MRLSVAYWLTQNTTVDLVLNISIYDLDDSAVQPVIRLSRNIPRIASSSVLTGYFLASVASVCSGLPSHIILYHYHSQRLPVPEEHLPLLTPSRRFLVRPSVLTHNLDSDSEENLLSTPESLYAITPDSPYSILSNSSNTSLSS
jgi:hypothetical protein